MKIFKVLFVLTLVLGACQSKKAEQKADQPVKVENVGEIVLDVEGMTCDGCEKTVETGLMDIEGVAEVKADHETGVAKVKADTLKVTKSDLAQVVEKVGYHAK